MGYVDNLNTTEVKVVISPALLPGLLSDDMHWQLLRVVLSVVIAAGMLATGANIVTITVYARLGFADSTNISLTALAISDLGIAITSITTCLGFLLPLLPNANFTYEVFLNTSGNPHLLLTRISAMITTYLSIERYLCVLMPLKIKSIITPKRTLIVMVVIFASTFCLVYPVLLVRFPFAWKFNAERNRTLLGIVHSNSAAIVQLHKICLLVISTILPFVTFFSVSVCTILLSLSLRQSKAWRDANKQTSSNVKTSVESGTKSTGEQSKEDKAVKMIITIATVFIMTTLPSCVHVVAIVTIPGFHIGLRYYRLFDVLGMSFFAVNSINSGANVIIYYKMSRKFRSAMLSLFRAETGPGVHSTKER